MHTFSIWGFSDKEINQIVSLVKEWSTGGTNPVDLRKYTKQVKEYAKRWKLIVLGSEIQEWNYEKEDFVNPWYVERSGKNRYYLADGKFDALHSIPVEALWQLVSEVLEDGKGHFTITHSKKWHNLGIWCARDSVWEQIDEYQKEKHGLHLTNGQSRYIPEMIRILNKLSSYGYIIFQYAGSVWQVTLTPERHT
jgi:hypothetical protein